MPAVQIRNVPADVHRRLRERARDERMSLGEYVMELIERDLALPSQREWAARLETRAPVKVDAAEVIDQGRRERDAELADAGRG